MTSEAARDPAAATSHRIAPLVHADWTGRWWSGDAELERCFGPKPSERSLDETAGLLAPSTAGWGALLHRPPATELGPDTLVVLAGQQPMLGGGPGLMAHKAATAIRLAHELRRRWERPVVPVFLLATEDHDSTEIDHIDFISHSSGSLRRLKVGVTPGKDAFFRSSWRESSVAEQLRTLADQDPDSTGLLASIGRDERANQSIAWHVAELLHHTFGHLGLCVVESHRLTPLATNVLSDALERPTELARELGAGAERLAALGLPASFEPGDPRPLVMESSGGRRRRVADGDSGGGARLAVTPTDFSPQAALRPVVQAATLPVVAQVCGPSELLYLGQARGLHARHGLQPPVLVPRLEATAIPADLLEQLGGDLAAVDLSGAATGPSEEELQLIQSAERFVALLAARDQAVGRRARRWLSGLTRDVRRLAEGPAWGAGGHDRVEQTLRPRGRWQDTVLAWLPDAWHHDQPRPWAEHIVSLCRPLEPPAHVLHIPPTGER